MPTVEMNQSAHRFEARLEDEIAFAEYRLEGDSIVFPHTVVPPAFEGQGVGSQLVQTGLEYAMSENLKVIPQCTFFARYIAKRPELHDLVHPEHRALLGD